MNVKSFPHEFSPHALSKGLENILAMFDFKLNHVLFYSVSVSPSMSGRLAFKLVILAGSFTMNE